MPIQNIFFLGRIQSNQRGEQLYCDTSPCFTWQKIVWDHYYFRQAVRQNETVKAKNCFSPGICFVKVVEKNEKRPEFVNYLKVLNRFAYFDYNSLPFGQIRAFISFCRGPSQSRAIFYQLWCVLSRGNWRERGRKLRNCILSFFSWRNVQIVGRRWRRHLHKWWSHVR